MEFEFRIYETQHKNCGESTWFFKGSNPIEVVEKFKQNYPEHFKYATMISLQNGKGCWNIQTILNNRSQTLKDFYSNIDFKAKMANNSCMRCY